MEISENNWDLVEDICQEHWSFELNYLNKNQITAIQKAINEEKPLQEFLTNIDGGLNFDLLPILENLKLIFEIVLLLANIVIIYKNKKSEDDLIIEFKKGKSEKELKSKFNMEVDDETLKKIIRRIEAYYQ